MGWATRSATGGATQPRRPARRTRATRRRSSARSRKPPTGICISGCKASTGWAARSASGRGSRRLAKRALPIVQKLAPFVPGGAAALTAATPFLKQAGVAGFGGLGALYAAPDGSIYQVQGVDAGDSIDGFADDELNGLADDELQGLADDDLNGSPTTNCAGSPTTNCADSRPMTNSVASVRARISTASPPDDEDLNGARRHGCRRAQWICRRRRPGRLRRRRAEWLRRRRAAAASATTSG